MPVQTTEGPSFDVETFEPDGDDCYTVQVHHSGYNDRLISLDVGTFAEAVNLHYVLVKRFVLTEKPERDMLSYLLSQQWESDAESLSFARSGVVITLAQIKYGYVHFPIELFRFLSNQDACWSSYEALKSDVEAPFVMTVPAEEDEELLNFLGMKKGEKLTYKKCWQCGITHGTFYMDSEHDWCEKCWKSRTQDNS